jgi:hypothetical protein
MALRLGKFYDALVEAGASDGVAKDAAEEIAEYELSMHDVSRKPVGRRSTAARMLELAPFTEY